MTEATRPDGAGRVPQPPLFVMPHEIRDVLKDLRPLLNVEAEIDCRSHNDHVCSGGHQDELAPPADGLEGVVLDAPGIAPPNYLRV